MTLEDLIAAMIDLRRRARAAGLAVNNIFADVGDEDGPVLRDWIEPDECWSLVD